MIVRRFLPFVMVLLAFVALALFEQDYLWAAQEQSLFLHTPLFFSQCMTVSGGLLSWAGAFLTQFFYHPLLGAAVLCLLWALLMLLLKQAFSIPWSRLWLTLVPVAMLLLTVVDLGYWIFFLKLRGHLFVATLGFIMVALTVWLFRLLPQKVWLQTVVIVVSAVVGYPLFGFYGLLSTLLMSLLPASSRPGWLTRFTVAVGCVGVVPLACYYLCYHQTPLANIYFTALPVFVHNGISDTWKNVPYVVIVLWMVALSLRKALPMKAFPLSVLMGNGVKWFVVAALIVTVFLGWYKNDNFHRELSMRRSLEQLDWEAMLSTFQRAKGEPTRAMCMMKNLALHRTARLMKDYKLYREGFSRPDAPFPVRNVHTVGKVLYMQFGLPNYCYRWCMEDGVEYGWTIEELKLMAKCSLLNGEKVAAQRYFSLIKKTTFHYAEMKRYERLLRQPEFIGRYAEFNGIVPLLRDDDFLTSDQSQLEPFLIEHLASAPGLTPDQRELASFCYSLYFKRFRYVEK